MVAPFAGAWIEIDKTTKYAGVKIVAPFAGAWIEIISSGAQHPLHPVAPFAGAWIEIVSYVTERADGVSLPSRERGLKLRSP